MAEMEDMQVTVSLPELVSRRFEIDRVLGKGGFGTTYAARDRRTQDEVALKVLHVGRLDDWKALELFEREAKVLASLDHPRIPDYVDFVRDDESGRAYLAQKLAPGQSIGAYLEGGRRFSQEEVVEVASQVLEILEYLQSRRPIVVHRDIKPENLMFAESGVYLVDFGAVRKVAGELGQGSTVAGTFGYMAPEQLRGQSTGASDIFGLGMTLIHMLTGEAPDRLEQRRMRPVFRDGAEISPAFAHLIDQMTELVVDDRIASASECAALLKNMSGVDRVVFAESKFVPTEGRSKGWNEARRKMEEKQQAAKLKERKRGEASELRHLKNEQKKRDIREKSGKILEIVARGSDSWTMKYAPPTLYRPIDRYDIIYVVMAFLGAAIIAGIIGAPLYFEDLDIGLFLLTWIWWVPVGLCPLGFAIWHFKGRLKKASQWTFQINDEWIHVQEKGGNGAEFAGSLSSMSFVTSQGAQGKEGGSLSISDQKSGMEVQIQEIEAEDLERMSSFLERL